MNIYIVTSGEYSDYRIERVFTTYKKAEQYVALQSRNPNAYRDVWNIECYPTYDEALEGEVKVYYLYSFSFRNDKPEIESIGIVGYQKKVFFQYRFGAKLLPGLEFTLDEEDEEKALKIAQDEYAKMRVTEF